MMSDNGSYASVAARHKAFSITRNYTQGAQGTAGTHHIRDWDIPLMPGDERPPYAIGKGPFWDPEPTTPQQSPGDQCRRPPPDPPPAPLDGRGKLARKQSRGQLYHQSLQKRQLRTRTTSTRTSKPGFGCSWTGKCFCCQSCKDRQRHRRRSQLGNSICEG